MWLMWNQRALSHMRFLTIRLFSKWVRTTRTYLDECALTSTHSHSLRSYIVEQVLDCSWGSTMILYMNIRENSQSVYLTRFARDLAAVSCGGRWNFILLYSKLSLAEAKHCLLCRSSISIIYLLVLLHKVLCRVSHGTYHRRQSTGSCATLWLSVCACVSTPNCHTLLLGTVFNVW